jgi:hypothetical protein
LLQVIKQRVILPPFETFQPRGRQVLIASIREEGIDPHLMQGNKIKFEDLASWRFTKYAVYYSKLRSSSPTPTSTPPANT